MRASPASRGQSGPHGGGRLRARCALSAWRTGQATLVRWGAVAPHRGGGSDRDDVGGRRTLRALLTLVADPGALGERPVAVTLDRGVVDEEVLARLIGGDEAEALLVAEPLHCSCGHVAPPSFTCKRDTRGAETSDTGETRALR